MDAPATHTPEVSSAVVCVPYGVAARAPTIARSTLYCGKCEILWKITRATCPQVPAPLHCPSSRELTRGKTSRLMHEKTAGRCGL